MNDSYYPQLEHINYKPLLDVAEPINEFHKKLLFQYKEEQDIIHRG